VEKARRAAVANETYFDLLVHLALVRDK
jgi:hypothetical protein